MLKIHKFLSVMTLFFAGIWGSILINRIISGDLFGILLASIACFSYIAIYCL